jgi:hypothetical protein
MANIKDARYDFASSKRVYADCSCEESLLRFYYCRCGARLAEMTAMANEIIPDLSEEQKHAMVETTGAIEQRTANRLGFALERLGLSTGISRSGDNADVLTDLGKLTQKILCEHTMGHLSS